MNYNKMSDQELYNLYEAMKSGQENTEFSDLCKTDGMSTTILNICIAISDRWYKDQQAKRAPLKVGDEVWYADKSDSNVIDRGIVTSVYYRNGVLDSIGVDFPDTNDFDEFYGDALTTCLFRTKEDAQVYLTQDHDQ